MFPPHSFSLRTAVPSFTRIFTRNATNFAPRNMKYIKRHKGAVPIPTGGSTKGTTLAHGEWGIRIKGDGARLSAKHLSAVDDVLKRKLKIFKGAKVYMRVFPDIPGNETRMGKGKGAFEFWATRVPTGRVIFEIGGTPIRESLARDILRQAAAKLPTAMEFIGRNATPRLGKTVLPKVKPPPPELLAAATSTSEPPSESAPQSAPA